MNKPVCAICGKPITWTFWVCEDCEIEWKLPKKYADWPEWVKVLTASEKKRRDRMTDNNRVRDGKELYISEIGLRFSRDSDTEMVHVYQNETSINMVASLTPEDWLIIKEDYACAMILDSDLIDLKDSDWEAIYSYGV